MKKYRFDATIEAGRGGGAFVVFPFDAQEAFGTTGRVAVNATFDGVPCRGSLDRMGRPSHLLGVPKAIRDQLGKPPGTVVAVAVWKDDVPRVVEVPADFTARMKRAGVLEFFEGLSFTHRKEYSRWITEAKKEETRLRRLDKAIDMLKAKVRTPG